MIQPIETWYAGCRFRSRLEARWAVFFDHIGLRWEYEAQGYYLPSGARYLPDFWLPEVNVAVEVKGDENAFRAEAPRYAEAVQSASIPGRGLLFLGPIPDPATPGPYHLAAVTETHCCGETILCLHAVGLDSLACEKDHPENQEFLGLCTGRHTHDRLRLPALQHLGRDISGYLGVGKTPDWPTDPKLTAAYQAARSARFEHGEQPAAPQPREEWPPVAEPGSGGGS